MEIGIGLPATIPGVEGRRILNWARQSEERGFASLGTKYAEGWVAAGAGVDAFKEGVAKLEKAWSEEGRSGSPRKMAIGYHALGPDAEKAADWYIHHYYEWLGSIADQIAAGVPTDEQAVKETVDAYAKAGCDELILFPCSAELDQVDLLAQAVL